MSAVGGLILLASGILFLGILMRGQMAPASEAGAYRFAVPLHMPTRIPVALNSFGLWLALMIGLTVVNYGYPIAQLMALKDTSVPVVYVGARDERKRPPLFSTRNPWFVASVGVTAAIAAVAAFVGLVWLPFAQPDLKIAGIWDAICSAAGVPRAASQATSIQPDFKTSDVVMTSEMLTKSKPGLDRPRRDAGATLRDLPRAARG